MKLVNCKVGTKVVVKANQVRSAELRFYSRHIGQVCTITKIPNAYGYVDITVDSDGSVDTGHHTNIRKYKGETA